MEDWVYIDAITAFDDAINKGILSDDETAKNYAGDFMYMGTKEGVHQFKNIKTRKYGFDLVSVLKASL